jgi:hypothetical protein
MIKRPEPGYVGIWHGITAPPPPRVGPAAPEQWPAKQPVERPPFLLKRAQEIASYIAVEELRLSDSSLSKQRLRDLKEHILERARESGLAFADFTAGHSTRTEFGRGLWYAETVGEHDYHKVRLRQLIDGHFDMDGKPIMEFDVICNSARHR